MRKVAIIILHVFLFSTISAQFYLGPAYSLKAFKRPLLSPDLNTSGSISFKQPLTSYGFNIFTHISSPLGIGWFESRPRLQFQIMVPQKISLRDSGSANINGFNIQATVFDLGFPIKSSKNKKGVSFSILDFNFGRMNLMMADRTNTNLYFTTKLGIQPWFRVSKFLFLMDASYEWDLSNPAWKTKAGNASKLNPNHLSFTGTYLSASVNYLVYERTAKKPKKKRKSKR